MGPQADCIRHCMLRRLLTARVAGLAVRDSPRSDANPYCQELK
jgi:hypothetical protein